MQIFKPFEQVEGGSTRRSKGNALKSRGECSIKSISDAVYAVSDMNADSLKYRIRSLHGFTLLETMIVMAKVESGKLKLEPSAVDIRSRLENSLVMIEEKALKQGIQLSVNVDGVPETIPADERKLKQIVYNLLSNAVQFAPDGGRIALTANPCRSEVPGFSGAGRFIPISVADNGIGLTAEDQERIFQPFEQAAPSGQKAVQGTGLGLSLTRQLVEPSVAGSAS